MAGPACENERGRRPHRVSSVRRLCVRTESIAEVLELEGDAEVVVAEGGDDFLEVVALLAGDADLIALGL